MQVLGLAFFLTFAVFSQDTTSARSIIDSLSSKQMWGRGYTQNGHVIAANYIADKFEKIGLEKYSSLNSYFQYFSFEVNVIKNCEVKSKKKLILGIDYLPSASIPSVNQTFKVLKDSISYKSSKNCFFLNSNKKNNFNNLYTSKSKLTHTFSQHQSNNFDLNITENAQEKIGRKLKLNINSELQSVTSQNVIGYISGTEYRDSLLIFCAHYDHLGGIGESCYFPGANDNASGIAMLLQIAEYYKKNPIKYSVLIIAFGAEEVGLIGSKYFVFNPICDLKTIKLVTNLDLMGSGKEGVTIVNGSIYNHVFDVFKQVNESHNLLKIVKPRGKAANSDHYFFSEKGVPAIFIYSLGEITAYHDINDTSKVVTLSKYNEMFKLITYSISKLYK
ncbi:MAG: M28 family peptidase [Cytophagales bacterium]